MILTVGDSMSPTYEDKELVILHKIKGKEAQRGDVVVVADVDGDNITKRIVGLWGDRIRIKSGEIYLNNKKYKNYQNGSFIHSENFDEHETSVPYGYVWVIGDNVKDSWYGLVPINKIMGRILY